MFFLGGVYFLGAWFISSKKKLQYLYAAIALCSFLLFKIPNILLNAGVFVLQTKWYIFFFVTMLLHLLGYFLLTNLFIAYVRQPRQNRYRVAFKTIFVVLFTIATAYFAASFISGGADTFAPVWKSHLLVFIPAEICTFISLLLVLKYHLEHLKSKLPVYVALISVIFLLLSSVMYILVQTGTPPMQFWYLWVISAWSVSLVQYIAGGLLWSALYVLLPIYPKK